jgi:hypothetical protein
MRKHGGPPTTYYHLGQLLQLREAIRTRGDCTYGVEGLVYISLAAVRRLGVDPDTLTRLVEEGRVERTIVRSKGLGAHAEIAAYKRSDVEAYLQTRGVKFDGVYPDGRINLTRAARLCGIRRGQLNEYIRKKWLHAIKQDPPRERGRRRREWTVLPEELNAFKMQLVAARRGARRPGEWATARRIGELVNAQTIEEGARLRYLLRQGRVSGAVDAYKPELPVPVTNGRVFRAWLYDLRQAVEYIKKSHNSHVAPNTRQTDAESGPKVVLQGYGQPAVVTGKKKKLKSFSAFKVVEALAEAWPDGLDKDELEAVNSAGRRILKVLRKDPEWAAVIHMAGAKGQRYRID